jgi:hypothetical protein
MNAYNERLTAETLPGLMLWLANGERGASSDTIVQHITGLPANDGDIDHPWDPGDLKRCRKLLEAVPALVPYMPRMRNASPVWAALVDHWQELCDLMDTESPDWRKGKGMAVLTYERMCALTHSSRTKEPA